MYTGSNAPNLTNLKSGCCVCMIVCKKDTRKNTRAPDGAYKELDKELNVEADFFATLKTT